MWYLVQFFPLDTYTLYIHYTHLFIVLLCLTNFISNKYHIFSSSPWLWKVYCWWHYWGSRTRTAHLSSPDVIPNKSPVWREQFFHRVLLWRYTKLQIGHKSSSTTIVSLSEREVFWSKVLLFKCKWMGFALLVQKWIIRNKTMFLGPRYKFIL